MPMDVRAKAMVSEKKRTAITVMAAMDIMAPRLVAYNICCVFWDVFLMCVSWDSGDEVMQGRRMINL